MNCIPEPICRVFWGQSLVVRSLCLIQKTEKYHHLSMVVALLVVYLLVLGCSFGVLVLIEGFCCENIYLFLVFW
jgi:hypothetical protein